MAFLPPTDIVTVTFTIVSKDQNDVYTSRQKQVDFFWHDDAFNNPATMDVGQAFINLRDDVVTYITALEALMENAQVVAWSPSVPFGAAVYPTISGSGDLWHEAVLSVYLDGFANKVGTITIPSPADALMDANGRPDIANATLQTFLALYTSDQSPRVSDGEIVRATNTIAGAGYRYVRKPTNY